MISVTPINPKIGAEILGVDLRQPLSAADTATIRKALTDHLVLFFKDQAVLTDEEHIALGEQFGTLDKSEIKTYAHERAEILVMDNSAPKGGGSDVWHRDRTYLEAPPLGSLLQCVQRAELGGDTCWASMYEAYDALSAPMRAMLDGLKARHSIEPIAKRSALVRESLGERLYSMPTAIHPVVEVHPDTGRKALNVNGNWTVEIVDIPAAESEMLLAFLFEHVKAPEFQVRFQWSQGDIAFWDNRPTLHYGVPDYTSRRIMRRVAILGHKPAGPVALQAVAA